MFYYLCRSELNGTHVRRRGRHSSQISPKRPANVGPRRLGGMRGPDGLMTKPYHSSALRARTQLCMYALSVFIHYGDWLPHTVCTVCTRRCNEAVTPGEINYTKTLLSFQAASALLNSFWLEPEQVKNVPLSVLSHKHMTSRRSVSDGAGPTVSSGVWLTSSVVF